LGKRRSAASQVEPGPAEGDHPLLHAATQQLREYFACQRRHFDLPLDLHGTDFQKQVWMALLLRLENPGTNLSLPLFG
jgi:O6-methylguanine-DNA--protein-cysteine methyltransferase